MYNILKTDQCWDVASRKLKIPASNQSCYPKLQYSFHHHVQLRGADENSFHPESALGSIWWHSSVNNLGFQKCVHILLQQESFSERNNILFVHFSDEMCKLVKEFSIQTTPTPMAMDGVHICFAVGLEYCMLDMLTGEIQLLFLRGTPEQIPLIRRVSNKV